MRKPTLRREEEGEERRVRRPDTTLTSFLSQMRAVVPLDKYTRAFHKHVNVTVVKAGSIRAPQHNDDAAAGDDDDGENLMFAYRFP